MNNVVHYHGTPVWGDAGNVHRIAVSGAGAFVSYARPDQLVASFKHAKSVAIDNGAFQHGKVALLSTGRSFISGLPLIIIIPNWLSLSYLMWWTGMRRTTMR